MEMEDIKALVGALEKETAGEPEAQHLIGGIREKIAVCEMRNTQAKADTDGKEEQATTPISQ